MADKQKIYEALVELRAGSAQMKSDLAAAKNLLQTNLLSMQGLARALAPSLSIVGIGAFLKGVIDVGDSIQDLSVKTGISSQLLSGLRPVFSDTGVSMEGFATGILKAQKNLGDLTGAGQLAAEAFKAMHLNVQELIKASPDEFLQRFAEGLGKVEDRNVRAAIATRVLGKAGAENLPVLLALADDFKKIKDQGLSPETLKSLDDFADGLKRLGQAAQNLAAGPLAKLTDGLLVLAEAFHLLPRTTAGLFGDAEKDVKRLSETVARTLGVSLEEVAGKTSQQLEDIARKAGSASASAAINALIEARRRLNDFIAKNPLGSGPTAKPKGEPTKLPDKTIAEARNKAAEAALHFAFGLEKEAIAAEGAKIALTDGEEALHDFTASVDFAAARTELFRQLLLIPGISEPTAIKIADRAFAEIRNRFDELTDAAKVARLELLRTQIVFESPPEGSGVDKMREDERKLFDDLRRQQLEIAKGPPVGEELQLRVNISEETKKKAFEQADALKAILGSGFDDLTPKISAVTAQLESFRTDGLGKLDPEIVKAKAELESLTFEKIGRDLSDATAEIDAKAKILGSDFDPIAEKISNVRRAIDETITAMRQQGRVLDENDPKLQQLKRELEDLKKVETVGKIFDDIADDLAQALENMSDNTKSFGDKMRDLMRNIAKDIQHELLQAFVLEPAKKALRELLGGLLEKIGIGIPTGGAATGGGVGNQVVATTAIETVAATAETAIEAASLSATAEIEASSAVGQAGLEALSLAATAGIEGIQTTGIIAIGSQTSVGISAIEAVKDAAIAAIEAMRLLVGGGTGPSIPFSFGGGSNSFESLANDFGGLAGLLEIGGGHRGGLVTAEGIRSYARGGFVDNRLARLQDGEFVLRKSAVESAGLRGIQQLNDTGRFPSENNGAKIISVQPIVHGSIIPNAGVPADKVVTVVIKQLSKQGAELDVFKQLIKS